EPEGVPAHVIFSTEAETRPKVAGEVGAADGCGFAKGQDSCCPVLRSSDGVHMGCSDRCRSEHSGQALRQQGRPHVRQRVSSATVTAMYSEIRGVTALAWPTSRLGPG